MNKPLLLVILDGWGYREEIKNNAIAQANIPYFKSLWENYPHSLLRASGSAVGLPDGQMGNSEVGHTIIGAGKIIYTDLARINKAIEENQFENNEAFKKLFDHVKKHNSTLHVKGLASDGGVHSHLDHLYAFIKAAEKAGISKIAIHAFTDGRDTPPQSSHQYLVELEKILEEAGIGQIATVTGRFYAMDRDNNWHRTDKAEQAIFKAQGKTFGSEKPSVVVKKLYEEGLTDELLEPIVFLDETGNSWVISKNDGVFFFNFRPDRAKQISKKILEKKDELNLCFATLTQYDKDFDCLVAFPPIPATATLAGELDKAGLKQAHVAETEKFAHVTYFFNGGKKDEHLNEKHILINSRKDIETHDQSPKMMAKEVADETIKAIAQGCDFILVNFANADMVGHTANSAAIIEAVEEVDVQLKRITEFLQEKGGTAIVTADHGNAEVNIDKNGLPHTAHTTNPVPFIITKKGLKLNDGSLADIAPTIMDLLQLDKPLGMTGNSLIKHS